MKAELRKLVEELRALDPSDACRRVNPAVVAERLESLLAREDEPEQTAEEATAELEAAGVDVPAFLARVHQGVEEMKERVARDRLGRWLAEDQLRSWQRGFVENSAAFNGRHTYWVSLFPDVDTEDEESGDWRTIDGYGATLADAINAALDAAKRSQT